MEDAKIGTRVVLPMDGVALNLFIATEVIMVMLPPHHLLLWQD